LSEDPQGVPDELSESLNQEEALVTRGPLQLRVVGLVEKVVPEGSNVREGLEDHVAVVVGLNENEA